MYFRRERPRLYLLDRGCEHSNTVLTDGRRLESQLHCSDEFLAPVEQDLPSPLDENFWGSSIYMYNVVLGQMIKEIFVIH